MMRNILSADQITQRAKECMALVQEVRAGQ